MQLDLIPSQRPRRLSRAEARQRRDIGMQRVGDKAERTAPGWCLMACESLRRMAAACYPAVFTIEHARTVLSRELVEPCDARVWGVVTVMAIKRGYIRRVKGRTLPAASSNGSEKPLFTKGPSA